MTRLYCTDPATVYLRRNTTTLTNEDKFASLASYLWHDCPSGALRVLERELAGELRLDGEDVSAAMSRVLMRWDARRVERYNGHGRGKRPYTFPRVRCEVCGASVAENWYARHLRSGCKLGVAEGDDGDGG